MDTLQQQYRAWYEDAANLLLHGSVAEGLDLCLDLRGRIDLSMYLRAMVNASLALYSDAPADKLLFANEFHDLATMMHDQYPDEETSWMVEQAQDMVTGMTAEFEDSTHGAGQGTDVISTEGQEQGGQGRPQDGDIVEAETGEQDGQSAEELELSHVEDDEDIITYHYKDKNGSPVSRNITWEGQFTKHWKAAKERETAPDAVETGSDTDTVVAELLPGMVAETETASLSTSFSTVQGRDISDGPQPTSSAMTSFSEMKEQEAGDKDEDEA